MKREDIKNILLKYWDPLLIGENLLLRDEYDIYVDKLFTFMNKNFFNLNSIVELLKEFEDDIGVYTDISVKKEVVMELYKFI